jgi:hypothetical protein
VQRLRMGAMGVREKRTELRSAVNRGDGVGLVRLLIDKPWPNERCS